MRVAQVPTRRFGRTELAMPVFSCGGMRYQHRWQDQPLDAIPRDNQENLERTVRRAFELGIRHVETARGYGSSERQLGQVLPQLPREELIVQTKVSPKADAREFVREFEDSLARLRLDHVDLFSLHGVNDAKVLDWALRPGGCFEAAQRLRDQGKCRFVGFSTHADLETILAAIAYGEARVGASFDYVNLHWYFIFQHNWPAISAAAARDMGVFIISPSDKGGRLYDAPAKLVDLCRPLTPMQFNDLFCLAHPAVHTLSIGAARPSDFSEHLPVCDLLGDAEEHLRPVRERLARAMSLAIGEPDPEAIVEGLPRWQDTPNHYNLPVILWLRNLALGWDLHGYAKWRFNMLTDSGHWFPGNRPAKVSEIDKAALGDALAGHPRRAEVVAALEDAVLRLAGEPRARLSQGG
jgi:predicted aldo/keto reductase-like oxidoreductase